MTYFHPLRSTSRRRAATTSLLAGAFAAATLASAHPASATELTGHRIDEDYVQVSSPDRTGHVKGWGRSVLSDGRIQVRVHGGVHRETDATGCRSAIVTFLYADGSREQSKESPRACRQYGVTYRDIDLHSTKNKDVVRYTVYLMRSDDVTAPASTVAWQLHYVGDAPDSYGTAARLDHDPVLLGPATAPVLRDGAVDWLVRSDSVGGVTLRYVRSRVSGKLSYPGGLAGKKAWLRVTWTYAGGQTSRKYSGPVTPAGSEVSVSLESDSFKEALSVELKMVTDYPTSGTPRVVSFGDFAGQ